MPLALAGCGVGADLAPPTGDVADAQPGGDTPQTPDSTEPAGSTNTTTSAPTFSASRPPRATSDTASRYITSSPIPLISNQTHDPIDASCDENFYVRAVQDQPPSPLKPSAHIDYVSGSGGVKIKTTTPADPYGNTQIYRSFAILLENTTSSDRTVTVSWWCDAVPSWYNLNPTTTSGPQQSRPTSPKLQDDKFWDFDALVNDAVSEDSDGNKTHLALNNSGNTRKQGNPLIGWPWTQGAQNQKLWGEPDAANYDGLPVFSYWPDYGPMAAWVIQAAPDAPHPLALQKSGGSVPRGGNWALLQNGIQAPPGSVAAVGDPVWGSMLLFNTDYDECLTGVTRQGDQLHLAPCDMNDPLQYWAPFPSRAAAANRPK